MAATEDMPVMKLERWGEKDGREFQVDKTQGITVWREGDAWGALVGRPDDHGKDGLPGNAGKAIFSGITEGQAWKYALLGAGENPQLEKHRQATIASWVGQG